MLDLITLHPKLVHFPIALIFTGLLFELIYLIFKKDTCKNVSFVLFNLGALSVIAAVISGLLAADTLGHDSPGHDEVHDHRNMMYIAGGIWLGMAIVFQVLGKLKIEARKFYIVVYFLVAGFMTVGAEIGGDLVYEDGAGVKPVMEAYKQASSEVKKSAGHDMSADHHKPKVKKKVHNADGHSHSH